MQKRGQATIFIIAGLVVLAVILLLLFLRGTISFGAITQEDLESQMTDIDKHIQDCLSTVGENYIWQIAKQGGYLTQAPDTFKNYYDYETKEANPISYLCFDIPKSEKCQNRMLTKDNMQKELAKAILDDAMTDCLQKENLPIKSRTQINAEVPSLAVNIGQDNIILLLDYPITLSAAQAQSNRNQFTANIQLPLGRLYDTAMTIVNSEALIGNFETLVYSVKKTEYTGKQYIVQKLQPYPDRLYKIKIKDVPVANKEFTFQFLIQDEDTFEK